MLQELFMSICLLTSLNCNDIYVDYSVMSYKTEAAAVITESGQYGILFNSNVRRQHGSKKKYLMVHEIAHLLVYEADDTNTTHNEQYKEICFELSAQAGLRRPKVVCAPRTECLSVLCSKVRRLDEE